MRIRRLVLVLLCVCCAPMLGCTAVKPWERGKLANPKMKLVRDPQAASFEQHVFEYREGSSGGYGTVGGGCGCN
jgi:hypothetical protein